jgi:hypothetical protein
MLAEPPCINTKLVTASTPWQRHLSTTIVDQPQPQRPRSSACDEHTSRTGKTVDAVTRTGMASQRQHRLTEHGRGTANTLSASQPWAQQPCGSTFDQHDAAGGRRIDKRQPSQPHTRPLRMAGVDCSTAPHVRLRMTWAAAGWRT